MNLRVLLVSALCSGLAVIALAFLLPRIKCPRCGMLQPRFRKPTSGRQAMRGGMTCAQCGCEMDRRGKELST